MSNYDDKKLSEMTVGELKEFLEQVLDYNLCSGGGEEKGCAWMTFAFFGGVALLLGVILYLA
jgi:hypothetical protein